MDDAGKSEGIIQFVATAIAGGFVDLLPDGRASSAASGQRAQEIAQLLEDGVTLISVTKRENARFPDLKSKDSSGQPLSVQGTILHVTARHAAGEESTLKLFSNGSFIYTINDEQKIVERRAYAAPLDWPGFVAPRHGHPPVKVGAFFREFEKVATPIADKLPVATDAAKAALARATPTSGPDAWASTVTQAAGPIRPGALAANSSWNTVVQVAKK